MFYVHLLSLVALLVCQNGVTGFVPHLQILSSKSMTLGYRSRRGHQNNSRSRLYYWFCEPNDEERLKEELRQLESARSSFENLMKEHTNEIQEYGIVTNLDSDYIPVGEEALDSVALSEDTDNSHMLLTTSGRRLRELEIKLLGSLKDSDAAVEELIHLWTTERDSDAATKLIKMQEECSEGLVEEEPQLHAMTEEYPGWSEPYSRLATVLYYKGRLGEAEAMAAKALELKPWHFEALNILVMSAMRQKDNQKAMFWTAKMMPSLDRKQRRQAWVEKAIAQANRQLLEAETITKAYRKKRIESSPLPELNPQEIWQ